MLVADLVLEHNRELGTTLLRALAEDSSIDASDRIDCIERLIDLDRESALQVMGGIMTDRDERPRVVVNCYWHLRELDRGAANAALIEIAGDNMSTDHMRAMAGVLLTRDGNPEGLRILREMATDETVPGFYRVHYVAEYGNRENRTSCLLSASRDPALPGMWRIFAAEELLVSGREVDALRAMRRDKMLTARQRARLRTSIYVYAVLAKRRGPLAAASSAMVRKLTSIAIRNDPQSLTPPSARRHLLPDERVVSAQRLHFAKLLRKYSEVP